jgi:hypothetical protein
VRAVVTEVLVDEPGEVSSRLVNVRRAGRLTLALEPPPPPPPPVRRPAKLAQFLALATT